MSKKINFKEISVHEGPERSPGFLLWHVSTSWRSFIEAALRPIGLTHPQFVVLATLGWLTRNGEKISQSAVGKMSGLDPNTVSQILKGLEEKELILREPSSDARAKNPFLTKRGRELLAKALPAVETADHQFFSRLNRNEMDQTLKIFQQLV